MNEEYIDGILYEVVLQYLRNHNTTVHEVLKYLEDKDYDKVHTGLSTKCKDMKLRSELSYEFVMNYLKYYDRCVINTKPDHNSLICSVILQLKLPTGLTSEIVQHQLAKHMATEVVFFFPIMEEYLKKYYILYNTCIKAVRTLSVCRPPVICMRFHPPKYFQLNSRARALLKREQNKYLCFFIFFYFCCPLVQVSHIIS